MVYIVNIKEIKLVEELALCNFINYIDQCQIEFIATKELAHSSCSSLQKLRLCNDIVIKVATTNSMRKDAPISRGETGTSLDLPLVIMI